MARSTAALRFHPRQRPEATELTRHTDPRSAAGCTSLQSALRPMIWLRRRSAFSTSKGLKDLAARLGPSRRTAEQRRSPAGHSVPTGSREFIQAVAADARTSTRWTNAPGWMRSSPTACGTRTRPAARNHSSRPALSARIFDRRVRVGASRSPGPLPPAHFTRAATPGRYSERQPPMYFRLRRWLPQGRCETRRDRMEPHLHRR